MSAVMSEQSGSNVAEFFSPGPGERLRAARLSMGYDLGKLASELHLTTSVVEMLEADEYDGIGARVFVRGYLRNYARIVGMPVDSILRQFDDKWPDDDPVQTVVRQSPRLPADGGPGRGLAGAVTWLLIIVTLVLFLMWWRGYLDEIVPGTTSADGEVVETAPLPEGGALPGATDGMLPLDDLGSDDGTLRLPAADDAAPDDNATQTGMQGMMAEPASLSSVTGSAPATQGDDGPGGLADTAAGSAVPDSASAAAPDATAAAGASAAAGEGTTAAGDTTSPAGGAPRVVLTFSAPCWVDVRDSERRFKLFGEMPRGASKVLGGTPPYKLVIGNAKAVDISIDGQPFDVMRYAKGNVARFTLDP